MSENIQVTPNTPDFSEQEQIRRDKLQTLMDNGQNPYLITKYDVTHESNQILANYETLEGQTVALAGRMIGRHIMGQGVLWPPAGRQGQDSVLCSPRRYRRGSLRCFQKAGSGRPDRASPASPLRPRPARFPSMWKA